MQRVGEMLTQIATNFHPEVFLQFPIWLQSGIIHDDYRVSDALYA